MPTEDNAAGETLKLTPEAALALLAERAERLVAANRGRLALGITGGPGVGKSTLATELVAALEARQPKIAAYVPMDGFHMRQAKLEALGLVDFKGAPQTFEAQAFVDFLARLKAASASVSGPGYSRKIEDVVDDAFTIAPDARLLVVEGNYLLVRSPPWAGVKQLLDLSVFLHVPRDLVAARLLKRHAEEGLFTEERNRAHIARTDLPNYDLVETTRDRADLAIDLVTEH
jgi:pantothenate kinase